MAASLAGVLLVGAWLLALRGFLSIGTYFGATYWHAHEMIFGFTTAVIAGFLLTAVGNWTQRETLVGLPLVGLCGVWLLGRVAILAADFLPRGMPALIDLAFLPVLAVAIARPIVATRDRRNYVMPLLLAALFCANACMHLGASGVLRDGQQRGATLGVDVVIVMVLVMTARIIPGFTRNATGADSIRSFPRLDVGSVLAMAVVTLCDAISANAWVIAIAAASTAVLAASRSLRWGALRSLRDPLLWILHVGHAWVPLGLLLRALSALTPSVSASLAMHAFTAGAISTLTLGMMARVALGHTGRPLRVSAPMSVAFALVTVAAVVRVFVPLFHPAWYAAALSLAGGGWMAAFGIYVIAYARVLLSPRVDGKPG